MSPRAAPLLALGMASLALAGCLGAPAPGEPLQAADEPEPEPVEDAPPRRAGPPSPAPSNRTPASPPPSSPPPAAPPPPPDPGPMAVLAHVDTGINPYHLAFRDTGPLAQLHPSTYLPGYPADALPLRLSLDAGTWDEAYQRDRALWEGLERGRLYWVPGTRIAGAISFGSGGALCPQALLTAPPGVPAVPPVLAAPVECPEHPVLDDHGHGTMTASRAAAAQHSLCPTCRIVSIEGLGPEGVRWAADQGWIDVQTNSWGARVPGLGGGALAGDVRDAFAHAAQRMLVLASSGNGLQGRGIAGEPTLAGATGAAGVVLVGAHDNGRVNLYHGQTPHVVADGYGGWRAAARSLDAFGASEEACCTSASSPYAAGGAAAILLEARRVLGHGGTGFPEGVGARGQGIPGGPLDDGQLALAELRRLLLVSATPRPQEGPDDGIAHWLSRGAEDPPADPTMPGENPYCVGCWTLPVRWAEVPREAPAWPLVGYGAVDPLSVSVAAQLLRGAAAMPERTAEDTLAGADQAARGAVDTLP